MYPVFPSSVFRSCICADYHGSGKRPRTAGVVSPQEHARRANEFLKANQPAKAIPEFAAMVAAEPDNLDAQANLGVLLYFQARHSDALEHLHKAIQINPNLPKIQALLGLCEYQLGQLDAARADLSAALGTCLTLSSAKKWDLRSSKSRRHSRIWPRLR